ncbi:hypothetical protein D3C73_982750 [compost metagenome]
MVGEKQAAKGLAYLPPIQRQNREQIKQSKQKITLNEVGEKWPVPQSDSLKKKGKTNKQQILQWTCQRYDHLAQRRQMPRIFHHSNPAKRKHLYG